MQQVIVITLIAAALVWLVMYVYRFLYPKAGGCAGGCGCGHDKESQPAGQKGTTQFLPSSNLVARLKARR